MNKSKLHCPRLPSVSISRSLDLTSTTYKYSSLHNNSPSPRCPHSLTITSIQLPVSITQTHLSWHHSRSCVQHSSSLRFHSGAGHNPAHLHPYPHLPYRGTSQVTQQNVWHLPCPYRLFFLAASPTPLSGPNRWWELSTQAQLKAIQAISLQ